MMLAAEMCSVWPSYCGLARALAAHHDVDAVIAENALKQADVGEARDIVEDERLIGEQARDHQGQSGVLRAGDRNRAVQLLAASDANAIHAPSPVPASAADALRNRAAPCRKASPHAGLRCRV